jgi:hypothetical protein
MSTPKRTLCTVVILVLAMAGAARAVAQDSKHEAEQRTVHGLVLDKSENAVAESVVFLRNTKTNVVRSSYTDASGKFRFSGLDPNVDYEIHAEKEDTKSATRTISSYDGRKDVELNLRMDKKKS